MKMKLNNDVVDNKLMESGKNIVRLSDYISWSEKLNFKCVLCGKLIYAKLGDVLYRQGCSKCNNKEKITNEVVDEFLEKRGIKRCNDYKNSYSKVILKCLDSNCGHEWEACLSRPRLKIMYCPRCIGLAKLSNEILDKRLISKNIVRVGEFINVKTPIELKCLVDGHTWKTRPNNITNCPLCANRLTLTNEIIDRRLSTRNVKRIGDVTSSGSIAKFKCVIDGYEWETKVGGLLNKSNGCPYCCGKVMDNKRLDSKILGRTIFRIGNYVEYKQPLEFGCSVCGASWKAKANSILCGSGCPKCLKKNETRIGKVITDIFKLEPLHNKRLYITNKEFVLFDYKFEYRGKTVIVEYNGIQHYEPVERFGGIEKHSKQLKRDMKLREFCLENKIILVEIPYWESDENQYKLLKECEEKLCVCLQKP